MVGRVGIEPTTFGLKDSYSCPYRNTPGLTRTVFSTICDEAGCPHLSSLVPDWPPVV